ncbi:unnamed protein product [Clonostachys rhizophaga]|uniref:Uncharacterized protein n=1 Tax=Clonostachys rhizophaga TaxID=160324 RepID=A0A9N9YII2_9HYPO|nr:unnamed protein product [Clonostachys rhizophaga]
MIASRLPILQLMKRLTWTFHPFLRTPFDKAILHLHLERSIEEECLADDSRVYITIITIITIIVTVHILFSIPILVFIVIFLLVRLVFKIFPPIFRNP